MSLLGRQNKGWCHSICLIGDTNLPPPSVAVVTSKFNLIASCYDKTTGTDIMHNQQVEAYDVSQLLLYAYVTFCTVRTEIHSQEICLLSIELPMCVSIQLSIRLSWEEYPMNVSLAPKFDDTCLSLLNAIFNPHEVGAMRQNELGRYIQQRGERVPGWCWRWSQWQGSILINMIW